MMVHVSHKALVILLDWYDSSFVDISCLLEFEGSDQSACLMLQKDKDMNRY